MRLKSMTVSIDYFIRQMLIFAKIVYCFIFVEPIDSMTRIFCHKRANHLVLCVLVIFPLHLFTLLEILEGIHEACLLGGDVFAADKGSNFLKCRLEKTKTKNSERKDRPGVHMDFIKDLMQRQNEPKNTADFDFFLTHTLMFARTTGLVQKFLCPVQEKQAE